MKELDRNRVDEALSALSEYLAHARTKVMQPVICGGAGLILSDLNPRTTGDIDIVALIDESGQLCSPSPLPEELTTAAKAVAGVLGLPDGWLNNGPSSDAGGIFQLGVPDGFVDRLTAREFGTHLKIYLIGRFDHVCFKLYAAADQGLGRHFDDLLMLEPSVEQLADAAAWARTHDVSEEFQFVLKEMLTHMGHHELAERI